MRTFFILLLLVFHIRTEWVPKILWTYWEEDIPEQDHTLKIFAYNHRNMISKDWQYRFLNKQNCWTWLNQIPNATQVLQKPEFQGKGQYSLRSKFIRLALLKHFGGVWIDYTIILTSNLNWLFKLQENSIVENKYKDAPDVFLTYNIGHGILEESQDKQTKTKILVLPSYETFFIAAKPNSKLITEWLQLFIFVNKKKENFQKIQKEKIWMSGYDFNKFYYKAEFALLALLQRKQRQFQKEWVKNGKKQEKKLVPRQYKIWIAQSQKMGYKLNDRGDFTEILIQRDIDEIKIENSYPDYFIKLNHYAREKNFKKITNSINKILEKDGLSQDCPIQSFINQNSMFYQYIFQFYPSNDISKQNSIQCLELAYKYQRSVQVDYSQKGQGLILMKLFENIFDGDYVDILNSENNFSSNTLTLLTKGWKGISVGLDYKYSSVLKKGDTYLNYLISEKGQKDMGKITLSDLCEKYYTKKPKFMNLGAESVQQNILVGNNWSNSKCRPEVILLNSENIKSISNLKINNYRFLSNLTFDGSSTGLIFVEQPSYKKYRQIIDNEINKKRKLNINFLSIKNAIDTIYPKQSISMIFLNQETNFLNIETIQKSLSKKIIFIFGNLKKIIVFPGKSNIKKKFVRINTFQFTLITAFFSNDLIELYIFHNKKGIQIIIDQYLSSSNSKYDFVLNQSISQLKQPWKSEEQIQQLDAALISYKQNISKKKSQQTILKIAIIGLIGIVVLAYFLILRKSQSNDDKKNINSNQVSTSALETQP